LIKKLVSLLLGKVKTNAESLVRQIAEQSLAEVCHQVEGRLRAMSLSEARGYVRARASQVVMRETRLAIANSREVDFTAMPDIVRQATERLVPQVISRTYVAAHRAPRIAA
jgi:transcriptional regulator of heat shock response